MKRAKEASAYPQDQGHALGYSSSVELLAQANPLHPASSGLSVVEAKADDVVLFEALERLLHVGHRSDRLILDREQDVRTPGFGVGHFAVRGTSGGHSGHQQSALLGPELELLDGVP